MRKRTRFAGIVAALATAVVVPAIALAGKPVVFEHDSFVDGPNPANFCGVEGTSVESGNFTFRLDANDAFHATEVFKSVFTATATGRSLETSSAGGDMGVGTDNGDGTVTFAEQNAGLVLKFRIPNGPLLKDADGKPIVGAGELTNVATFDIATGDLISIEESWHGPHPLRDGVDICGPAIAYLTS